MNFEDEQMATLKTGTTFKVVDGIDDFVTNRFDRIIWKFFMVYAESNHLYILFQ